MVTPEAIAWADAKRANAEALRLFMGGYVPVSRCDDTFARLLEAEAALLAVVDAERQ
jgi:hypothetical protein